MPTESRIRVAVVEDQPYYLSGLADAIDALGDYEVVVRAGNGEEYIKACKGILPVAITIVDLCMPVMDGWATIAWIREHQPGTVAAAITFEPHGEPGQRAYTAGARALVDKYLDYRELRPLLDDLHVRKFHMNPLMEAAMRGPRRPDPPAGRQGRKAIPTNEERLKKLSKREWQILGLVLHLPRLTNERIAARLNIGECTVETHLKNIGVKLGVRTREEMVLFAAVAGWRPGMEVLREVA